MNYQLTWFLRRHATAYNSLEDLAAQAGVPESRIHSEIDDMAAAGFRFEHHPIMGLRLGAKALLIGRYRQILSQSERHRLFHLDQLPPELTGRVFPLADMADALSWFSEGNAVGKDAGEVLPHCRGPIKAVTGFCRNACRMDSVNSFR